MRNRNWLLRGLAALAIVVVWLLIQQSDVGAASLKSRITVQVQADLTSTSGLSTATAPLFTQRLLDFANGNGANQANVVWSSSRTLTASASENLDLVGGGLTDSFGIAIAPARLRAIIVMAAAANTNNVVVGGNVNSVPFLSTAATTISIQPGGVFVITAQATAGFVVTAGTGDIIQVANSGAGTSVSYDIIVLGTAS